MFGKSRRQFSEAVDNVDSSSSRARFAVLIVITDPHYEVLMSAVKTEQSEGIPGAGIPEQAVTGSAAMSLPNPYAFFALVFSIHAFPTISEPRTG